MVSDGPGAAALAETLVVPTQSHREMVDITAQVRAVVRQSGVRLGQCLLFVPHTTAALTINENADPDVVGDLLTGLTDLLGDEGRFRHSEGNAGGHLLSALLGVSVTVWVEGGDLALGQWQAIYLCEFDGPRQRHVWVRIVQHD